MKSMQVLPLHTIGIQIISLSMPTVAGKGLYVITGACIIYSLRFKSNKHAENDDESDDVAEKVQEMNDKDYFSMMVGSSSRFPV